ncbi:hypothetical protein Tco_0333487 [Tanacetum coccineum]
MLLDQRKAYHIRLISPGPLYVLYTKPLDSLKSWNDHFFLVDDFACPASFPWNTSKTVSKDHFPKHSQYNVEHYATLVAYPAPFHKYPEPFLSMDLLFFIWTADPTKVRIGERQRGEDGLKLLNTTVGRTVPLLPVAPARAETKTQKKRKIVVDAGEPSHPAKKLRDDHETLGGPTVGGKSCLAVQCLLGGAVLNAEVRGEVIPTLPFVTSSVSATPEREEGDHTDSLAGANPRTIGAPTSVPLMTMTTTVTSTANPATTAKEKLVESSVFGDGSSSGADHTVSGFSGLTSSDFIVSGIHTVVSPDTDLQKVYIPQWSVTNGSRLDNDHTCHEMVDEFAPPKFFALIRGMEHDQLFTKFNVGAARQMSLSAEVRMRAEFNIREKRRLSSFVEEKNSLLKARNEEIKSLKAQLLVKEVEAAEAIHLRAEASKFKVVEKSHQDEIKSLKERNTALEKENGVLDVRVTHLAAKVKVREQKAADSDAMLEKFQDEQMAVVHEKFNKLDTDFIETCLHLEEKFYPHLLTTIDGRRAAISKAIEKGMQDGLAAGITHGREESNKDASLETVIDLLRLDEALVERLGLNESQPHVDQLMVHVHHSPDQTVIGARALSLYLYPLSTAALEGTGGTSSVSPDTITTLFVTLVSASTISPISMDDYEVMHTDGQEGTGADVDPFPNVDDAKLIIS